MPVDVALPLLADHLFLGLWLISESRFVTVPQLMRCCSKDPGPIKGVRCPAGELWVASFEADPPVVAQPCLQVDQSLPAAFFNNFQG
ncbi:hypothetical protein R3I94_018448 [Phoxinus phoxinus]